MADSIIYGVSRVLKDHKSVIVLEDDLIASRNFLDFMNQALNFYKNDINIFSISGYTMNLPSLPGSKDYYFGLRASSWGWGVWKNKWKNINWNKEYYTDLFDDKISQKKFNLGGSDLTRMLRHQYEGKIDSWAIRFCYNQYKQNLMTVFPTTSKIISIGFGEGATHTNKTRRFNTKIDNSSNRIFEFNYYKSLDMKLVREHSYKFSIWARFIDKLYKYFSFNLFNN